MLKVTLTSGVRDLENEVLASWDGHHAARLLERDDRRHARLLQRLNRPSLAELADPVTAMAIAGDLAARLAIEPPPGVPRMADFAMQFATRLEGTPWSRFGPLCGRNVRAAAATFCELGTSARHLAARRPSGQQRPAIAGWWLGGDRPARPGRRTGVGGTDQSSRPVERPSSPRVATRRTVSPASRVCRCCRGSLEPRRSLDSGSLCPCRTRGRRRRSRHARLDRHAVRSRLTVNRRHSVVQHANANQKR